ncbi:MBL fold metallo-hydrolase [Falsihalocynthiibacter sp. CO-5D18]|uniref:MBL fold metallo-hydrolase n=1 Tax=Falsihalocynthiibacter sp. CO-5D18 TaxID=3240872 RepID=UPI00350EEEB4
MLKAHPLAATLTERLAEPPGDALSLFWLGQAGFVIDGQKRRVVIDPYLSNSLGEKYQDTRFPHLRMMPIPIAPRDIPHVDIVLATHAHTDHLDPDTLQDLLRANPRAVLVAPKSARDLALTRSQIAQSRLHLIEAHETLNLAGVQITALRAAHEGLELDAEGLHKFLGLAVTIAGRVVFHSGDTIPFDGQSTEVASLHADLGLFPVNGRDAVRKSNGVPGNMTIAEAVTLAQNAHISTVIAHHFGLFAFNSVEREEIEKVATAARDVYLYPAKTGAEYRFLSE